MGGQLQQNSKRTYTQIEIDCFEERSQVLTEVCCKKRSQESSQVAMFLKTVPSINSWLRSRERYRDCFRICS